MNPFQHHDWKKNIESFQKMSDWQQSMGHFFNDSFWNQFDGMVKPNNFPQVNMYQTDHELLLIVSVPGLTELDDFKIYVDYTTIELKGVIDIHHDSGNVVQEEIPQGAFERSLTLPFPVRINKIEATYRDGLVFITLHRLISEENQRNRIRIQLLDDD